MATADDVKSALNTLKSLPNFKTNYKSVDNQQTFNNVCIYVNKILSGKEIDDATSMLVAQVIKEHFKNDFHFGAKGKEKIGQSSLSTIPPLAAKVAAKAEFTDLKKMFTVGSDDYKRARGEVGTLLKVVDKTHSDHGNNFKGNQTLEAIIKNVCAPVEGQKRIAEMKELAWEHYNYKF